MYNTCLYMPGIMVLIRRSSAICKFVAEFLTYDYRTIIKAFLKNCIAILQINLQKYRTKTLRQIILIFCRWITSLAGGSSRWGPNEVVVHTRHVPQTARKMVRNQRPRF